VPRTLTSAAVDDTVDPDVGIVVTTGRGHSGSIHRFKHHPFCSVHETAIFSMIGNAWLSAEADLGMFDRTGAPQ